LWFASRLVKATPAFSLLSGNRLTNLPAFDRLPLIDLAEIVPFPEKYEGGKFFAFTDIYLGIEDADGRGESSPGDGLSGDPTKAICRLEKADRLSVHCFVWTPRASDQLASLGMFWRSHAECLSRKYPFGLADACRELPFSSWVRVSGRLLDRCRPDVRRMLEVWRIEPAVTQAQQRLLPYVSPGVPAFQEAACPLPELARFIHVFWGWRLAFPGDLEAAVVSVKNTGCTLGELLAGMAQAFQCACYWDGTRFQMTREKPGGERKDFEAAVAFSARTHPGHVLVERVR
jgi:hypothetical protein